MPEFIDLIPYETSNSKKEASAQLAAIMDIPEATVPRDADYNQVVAAMAGVILYRHIENHQRHDVMKTIHQFERSHRPFYGQLQGKIALIIAQPRWEQWSLTNQELQRIVSFHQKFGRFSTDSGINPGAYGVGASVWQMIKQGATKGNVVGFSISVILVGLGEASHATGESANSELERRLKIIPNNPVYPGN